MNIDENDKKSTTLTLQPDESTRIPDKIGNYRILEVIGRGGMGTVYLAQQEKPIKRKVAIKVVKPGMDSKEILARFESEQQALALMNHLNIAQVYESGITEQGYSYFVMEYVPGEPITKHCDKYKLSIDERLGLFLDLCDAVQHAHYKGIVHRDIKPTNVLVAFRENKHIPKIIDFGVAKALTGQGLTEKTMHTQHGIAVGTPIYMSPEQAELTGYDIDTRTDIYSLGVLLYEMLVGAVPFSEEELQRAGILEILRVIREEEPIKPSTRFDLMKDKTSEIAKNRGTFESNLKRQLRGDLDWIVMKAMEKDRRRRYSTAGELAADISRFLNKEAIKARPASLAYKTKKFVRRHKAASLSAAVILSMIIVSYLWNMGERRKAEKSAKEANYNFAIALKEKAKASSEINQWQLVKLFGANSLLYQERAQKQLPMGDIELPFGEMDWVLKKRTNLKDPLFFWISPDCKHAVFGADLGASFKVLRIPEGSEVLTFKGDKPRSEAICFSADGRLLAYEDLDQTIHIWDLATKDEVRVWKNTGAANLMSFSPNGRFLVWGSKIWGIADGKVEKLLPSLSGNSIDFNHSGYYLTVTNDLFNKIEVIDVLKGKVIDTIRGRKLGSIYSPSGKYMAIGGLDDEIKILEPSNRKQIFSLKGHDDIVTIWCFSSDERYLASGSRDNSIIVYDLENNKNIFVLKGHKGTITSIDFSHDSKYLVSGSQDKTIRLWNLATGNEISTMSALGKQDISARFSPDDSFILTYCSNKLDVWELSRNEAVKSLLGHNDKISSVQFSPDGQHFASASDDKTIRIWEISSGRVTSIIKGHDESVNSICFSPEGKFLASGSNDKKLKIWDTLTGKEITALNNQHEAEILSVRFGLSGNSLFSRARDGYCSYWELEKGEWTFRFIMSPLRQTSKEKLWREKLSTEYYPDKKLFAYAHGNDIEVVRFSNLLGDADLLQVIFNLESLGQKITEGQKFVGRKRANNFRPDKEKNIIAEKIITLSRHGGSITSISISPDGKYLASAGTDKTIKIWDLPSKREVATLRGHSDVVTSIDFSPDGNYLISGSQDKTIMLWKINAIMNYLWLGLERPYKEKDMMNLLLNIEKQTGLSLKNMTPIDASPLYSGTDKSQ